MFDPYILAFQLLWQQIKMTNLHQNFILGGGLLNKQFQKFKKKFCHNTCNKTAIKANFHFPHYKSMENLSYHSN